MSKAAAHIYIVDDEADVRDSLSRLLRSADYAPVGFASAADFLQHPMPPGPACVLLDVNMPGLTGPELHEVLAHRGIGVPVVYLTGRSSIAIGVQAMKQGAVDFLEKPVDEAALFDALGRALELHGRHLQQRGRAQELAARVARLSGREGEVMAHVIAGRLNKQIAGDLGIAEKTVKVHRGRVMSKMQVRSVAELVHLCDELEAARPGSVPRAR